MHDNNSVIAFNRRRYNCENISLRTFSSGSNFNDFDSLSQRNQYLFLPWIILGIMLCIGLLVDVIYTAVVFFLDDHTVTGVLWLVIGIICVGELSRHFVAQIKSKKLNFKSNNLSIRFSRLLLHVGSRLVSFLATERTKRSRTLQPNAVQTISSN